MNKREQMLNCFACGKAIKSSTTANLVDTRDAQTVFVGPDCYKKVVTAGEQGYQSPKGGPKLYPLKKLLASFA